MQVRSTFAVLVFAVGKTFWHVPSGACLFFVRRFVIHWARCGYCRFHRQKHSAAANGTWLTCAGNLPIAGMKYSSRFRPTNEWQERLDFIPKENFLHVSIRNSFGVYDAKRIARFVEANRIDILHAHVARDYVAASIACRIAGKAKLVVTRHVVFSLKPFHRFALRNVDAAIAVSLGVKVQLDRIFPAEKVTLIPNGIDVVGQTNDSVNAIAAGFRELSRDPARRPARRDTQQAERKGAERTDRDFVLAANEMAEPDPGVQIRRRR